MNMHKILRRIGVFALFCLTLGRVVGAQTTISFDDLPAGTVVTNQYHSSGIDFSGIPNAGNDIPAVVPFTGTPSAPNALNISYGTDEFPSSGVRGVFTDPHHNMVSVRNSSFSTAVGVPATLTVYDASGTPLGSVTGGTSPAGTFGTLTVTLTSNNIASFQVTSVTIWEVIDDVTFDQITSAPAPDFFLTATTLPVFLVPGGGGATTNVTIGRSGGSTGNITLSLGNLPTGVTGSLSPNPSNGPSGTTSLLTLSASTAATLGQMTSVTVVGTPSSTAGAFGTHSVNVPITIQDSYDAEIVGIEVTQGIQTYDLPRGSSGTTPVSGFPVAYSGVSLAAGGKTVVRVFANYRTAPSSASDAPDIQTVLHGYDQKGVELPGSPLLAISNTAPLVVGSNFVDDLTRDNPNSASIFVLPDTWAQGTIILKAQLNTVPVLGGNPGVDTNLADDTFTLTNIAFTPTKEVGILEVPMTINWNYPFTAGFPQAPETVYEETRNLLPIGETQFYTELSGYIIDISDIASRPPDQRTASLNRLYDLADDDNLNLIGSGLAVVGVYNNPADVNSSFGNSGITSPPPVQHFLGIGDTTERVSFITDTFRFRTVAAHEFGHLLGRAHASAANNGGANGQVAEPWPPDQLGYLQGVGLDRRDYSIKFGGDSFEGRLPALPAMYDFMSYAVKADDPHAWISTKGWQEEIGTLATGAAGSGATPLALQPARAAIAAQSVATTSTSSSAIPSLRVRGTVDANGNFQFAKVGVVQALATTSDSTSDYHLRVRDRRGHVYPDIPMDELTNELDESINTLNVSALCQQLDPNQIDEVEVVFGKTVLGRKVRSAHAPEVRLLSVEPDITINPGKDPHDPKDCDNHGSAGKGNPSTGPASGSSGVMPGTATRIRWFATDADHDPLMTKIDFSGDGGNTWRPLFLGPNQNEAVLLSTQFTASSEARVRLRVNDGFNETTVVSKPFTAIGAPPRVTIRDPLDGSSAKAGGSLYLSGTATDDARQLIPGTSLTWSVGNLTLGTGKSISVSTLPVGTNTLTLTAIDSRNRISTATVTITITP
jgi:hypothetical protein